MSIVQKQPLSFMHKATPSPLGLHTLMVVKGMARKRALLETIHPLSVRASSKREDGAGFRVQGHSLHSHSRSASSWNGVVYNGLAWGGDEAVAVNFLGGFEG